MGSALQSVLKLSSLVPALSQQATNGASVLGTITAPRLPAYLSDPTRLPDGFPWGDRTVVNTNPYEKCPFTGSTRNYDLRISRGTLSPDGVPKVVILINESYPGPLIQANWCDVLNITVHNEITNPPEGTSVHWHGFLQKDSQWSDGVPSVSQCPIPPGRSMTYTFKAQLYGTGWYHSHYSAQYAEGVFGPLVIYGPNDVNSDYDIDLGPVMLGDYYNDTYDTLIGDIFDHHKPPSSTNNMINGKMNRDCASAEGLMCTSNAGLSKFRFESGKRHRLRLINSGCDGLQHFTIDEHNMTVITNDFVPIVPYTTNNITLGVGQRTDVIVEAHMPSDSAVWMRSEIDSKCGATLQPHALAAIYYDDAHTDSVPRSQGWSLAECDCGNDDLSLTVPAFRFPAMPDPTVTQIVDFNFTLNETGQYEWLVNGVASHGNYNHPILPLANMGNTSYDDHWNVYNFGANTSVRVILRNWNPSAHPMHVHGHNFFVIGDGVGEWDGTIINGPSPQRRDTQMLRGADPADLSRPGYLVVQYDTDNPGVWPFHCHVAWHVSQGLYLNMLEQGSDLQKVELPPIVSENCKAWDEFSSTHKVDQIDSGLMVQPPMELVKE